MTTNASNNDTNNLLPTTWLTMLTVLLVLAVLASAYGTYRFFASRLIEETQENLLTSRAKIKATEITMLLHERYNDIKVFSKRLITQFALTATDSKRWISYVDAAIADQIGSLDFQQIILCNASLQVIAPTVTPVKFAHIERGAMQSAINKREMVLVNPYLLTGDNEVFYGIAQPIFTNNDANNAVIGALYFRLNANKILFSILAFEPAYSNSAETLVARRAGENIVFISPLRLLPAVLPTTLRISIDKETLAKMALVNGEFGFLNGLDYRGIRVIGVAEKIAGTDWALITKVDRIEVESHAIIIGIIVFTVATILLLLLTVILRLFWQRRLLEISAKQAVTYKRYMTALHTSIDGYMLIDGGYKVIDSNPALSRITGYDIDELKTLGIANLELLENAEEIVTHGKKIIAAKGARFTSRWRRKDHKAIDVDISVSVVDDSFSVFVQDITESKAAKDALIHSNARFDALVACIPVGVYVFRFLPNDDMLFEYVSPRFCEILNIDATSVLADISTVFSATHPDELNDLVQTNIKAGKTLLPFKWEGRFVIRGEIRYLQIASNPTPLAEGGSLWHGMIADITERKEAETELARSNAELAQFAYVASHDLRQPLRTISNYLSLLQRKLGNIIEADSKIYMDFAISGAKRMDALILALLEYSRVGRMDKQPQSVALDKAFSEALLNLELAITESGTRITSPKKLPTVTGNAEELVRLFQNLIGNAIRYQIKGNTPQITVDWRDAGHEYLIWIRDNGIGINPKDYERAFGIFQRLVTREEYEGTGIGLAVCRKIAQHHGGRIWIESTLGAGSTFFITFPKNA